MMDKFKDFSDVFEYNFISLFDYDELEILKDQYELNYLNKAMLLIIMQKRIEDIQKFKSGKKKFTLISGGGKINNDWPKPILRRIK